MSATPFIVTCKNLRKTVCKCKEFANIYDDVVLKFSNCPKFSRRIKMPYQDEEVNDFIKLDSPFQYDQRKSISVYLQRKLVPLNQCKEAFLILCQTFFPHVYYR